MTAGAAVHAERLEMHRDARGTVLEPLRPDQIAGQRNVHVVVNHPGCVRGNHFHRRGTEVCVVYGPALFRIRTGDRVHDTAVPAGEAYRFTIPPLVSHAVRNTGIEPHLLVAFNTVEHDPDAPDTFGDVILE